MIPAQELVDRFSIPAEQLEEHLSLLNLVNFGGGCYAVYAELQGDEVHVDKELFGDTFRRPPRLTPLEARAIRLALEFVGPMIAAGAHSPLDRVRAKLEETFGAFDLAQTPAPHVGEEEDLVDTLTRAIDDAQARRARVPEARGAGGRHAHGRAVLDRAPPAALVRPHVGRRARPAALVPPRPHAQGEAAAQGLRAARGLRPVRAAHTRRPRASGTRRRSPAGRSRRAHARSSTARRSPRSRSAAPSGSSARWSRTAARRSCSSRRAPRARRRARARARGASCAPARASIAPTALRGARRRAARA